MDLSESPTTGLGEHCVGTRVVVRRRIPGETGPSGGPALTDLLGVMESWSTTSTRIRTDAGVVEVPLSDIVAGKRVPDRPPRRSPRA